MTEVNPKEPLQLGNMGSLTIREPTIRTEREYAVTEDDLESLSTASDTAQTYLGLAFWFLGLGPGLFVQQYFVGTELENLEPMMKLLCWFLAPLCAILGLVFLYLCHRENKTKQSKKDRIIAQSKPRARPVS